jgi:hypothetical protein
MSEGVRPYGGSVGKGFGFAAAMNVGGLVVSALTIVTGVGIFILLAFGLTQLLWLVPLYAYYKREGETETAKGVLIAAGISFLLNATCWGVVLSGQWRIGG